MALDDANESDLRRSEESVWLSPRQRAAAVGSATTGSARHRTDGFPPRWGVNRTELHDLGPVAPALIWPTFRLRPEIRASRAWSGRGGARASRGDSSASKRRWSPPLPLMRPQATKAARQSPRPRGDTPHGTVHRRVAARRRIPIIPGQVPTEGALAEPNASTLSKLLQFMHHVCRSPTYGAVAKP